MTQDRGVRDAGKRRIQSVLCGHACSTLTEAFTATRCSICDGWHSSLHLIIFPSTRVHCCQRTNRGENAITLVPSRYSFGLHLSLCLSPSHPAWSCRCWRCVFSIFTQQSSDTSALLDLLPTYKCEFLAMESQKRITQI